MFPFNKANLIEKEGILFNKKTGEISYPLDGNNACFNIEDESWWFKHRNNCIINLAKKYVKDNLILDIGGGNGYVSKGLQDNGIQSCLIEPGVQGCLNAKKRGLTDIVCSDFENLDLDDNSVSAVGIFDVIEHIEDDLTFLKKINKILIENGNLILTVPAYKILWSNEDSEAGHYRRYTIKELKNKLNESGFKIVYSTYIFSFLILPIFLFRTIPSILKIKKNTLKQAKKEHSVNEKSITNKLLNILLNNEITKINKNKTIPFGGSCLIAAIKE